MPPIISMLCVALYACNKVYQSHRYVYINIYIYIYEYFNNRQSKGQNKKKAIRTQTLIQFANHKHSLFCNYLLQKLI